MTAPEPTDATRAAYNAGTITLGEAYDRTINQIEVDSWLMPWEAREKYNRTHVWDRAVIQEQVTEKHAGQSWHIGNGVWLSVCGHCPAFTLTYGAMPVYATIGPHMVAEHGVQVAGINAGLLA